MKVPPYVQRSLIGLVVLLTAVSVARLLVTMHQQDERISILEAQVDALLADTSRLQITSSPHSVYTPRYAGRKQNHKRRTYSRDTHINNDSVSEARKIAQHEDGRPRKFTEPHLFDLNTIDSLTLIRIPGIAARTASTILKQRQRYGGFYDANQLRDFLTWDAAQDYLDEWCSLWFTASADRLVHIPLNTATIGQLQRHPYISHEQAVEISQYRTRHKGFRQASELQQLSTLTSDDIKRLLPYLSFES